MDLRVDTGFHAYEVAMLAARQGLAMLPRLKRSCPKLADQFSRALTSVPLNISEGSGRQGKDRNHFFRIAYGSANEASTALQLLLGLKTSQNKDAEEVLTNLDRVRAMIWRLVN